VTKRILLSCLLFGTPVITCRAQTTSTEVLGAVTDSSGALIQAARVTLLRTATGEKRETLTDSSGNYSFPLIEIGEYTVSVEKQGFKTQTATGVTVELQQKARVNFEMQLGATTERVEVVAAGGELKTDDAAIGGTVDHTRVVELPVVNRNFASLLVLTPGVQFGTRMGMNGLSTASSFWPGATQVSANGQRDANQRVTLDGVIASEPLVNTVYLNPSIDAIEEVKIQTASYSAEYGMNNGAIVQVALKAGGNAFHGTFYEFLRNDAADAKDYFLNFQLRRAPRCNRRTGFVGTSSGPGCRGRFCFRTTAGKIRPSGVSTSKAPARPRKSFLRPAARSSFRRPFATAIFRHCCIRPL